MLTSLPRIRSYFLCSSRPFGAGRYPQRTVYSSHVCVSAPSPSASFSLFTKTASYLRRRHASTIWPETEREERRIWSVSEYISSRGNFFDNSNSSIATSTESLYTSNSQWYRIFFGIMFTSRFLDFPFSRFPAFPSSQLPPPPPPPPPELSSGG